MAKHERGSRTSRTIYGLSTKLIISASASLGTIAAAGCIEIQDGHCALGGGDIACGEQKCVMSLETKEETADGCMDDVPARGGFVHVKYGLPGDFATFEEHLETAVDRSSPPLACNMEKTEGLRPSFDVLHAEVIAKLDGKSRVRRKSIDLGRIDDFTKAVDGWIEENCEAQPGGGDTAADTDTGLPPDDSGSTTEDPSGCPICPSTAPFCDPMTLECVGCDEMPEPDDACAGLDSNRPLCVGGACVACTAANADACGGELCDGESHMCVPCTEHSQCEAGACELLWGTCFPEDAQQLLVDADGGAGVESSVAEAVDVVEDGGFAVIRVRAFGSMGEEHNYDSVVIDGGKTIALLAAPGGPPRITGSESPEVLRVVGPGTAVYVDDVRLSGHENGIGLRVTNGLAWLDRTRVVRNSRGGIVVEANAQLFLRNSIVGGNGASGADQRGLEVNAASANLLYTTLAMTDANVIDSIRCRMGGTVKVRNSIVVGRDADSIDCEDIDITNSALDEIIGDDEDANENVGAGLSEWFDDVAQGDYRLTALGGTVFADIAMWQLGDPSEDIDGDPRPTTPGAPDHAGADIP